MIKSNSRDNMYFIISFICLSAMFMFPDTAKLAAENALLICVKSIIPSLFPFVVFTRILLNYFPFANTEKNCKSIFCGLNINGMIIFLLGIISGLPTGAVLAFKMYERSAVSLSQARRIAIYSSVVSPAFCIVCFGNDIMNRSSCGLAVYISIVIISICIMCVEYYIFGGTNKEKNLSESVFSKKERKETFTALIVSSFMVLLNICAFVMFFMCIGEVFIHIIEFTIGPTKKATSIICGILEFSGGISKIAALDFGERFTYGAILLGFGGISAIMQIMDSCSVLGIGAGRLLCVKVISAICVPFISALMMYIMDLTSKLLKDKNIFVYVIMLILFVTALAFIKIIVEKCRKNIRKANLISKI